MNSWLRLWHREKSTAKWIGYGVDKQEGPEDDGPKLQA